jgi:hypothetical protein
MLHNPGSLYTSCWATDHDSNAKNQPPSISGISVNLRQNVALDPMGYLDDFKVFATRIGSLGFLAAFRNGCTKFET